MVLSGLSPVLYFTTVHNIQADVPPENIMAHVGSLPN
jgi:hypothetical protein